MKKCIFLLCIGMAMVVFLIAAAGKNPVNNMRNPVLIAHAGGEIGGYPYANALEGLQQAANRGFTYIELDMITTSDGKIVLNHDWDAISNRIPGAKNTIMTHAEFMNQRIYNQFTPVDLNGLIEFLQENPNPRIITDTKDTDYAALYAIAEIYPAYSHRFIPQVYSFDDVSRIRRLGFQDIILTIYLMESHDQNPKKIHRFARKEKLYAVTIPESLTDIFSSSGINTNEVRYMTHTIDSKVRAEALFDMGFSAVYTGFLCADEHQNIIEIPLPFHEQEEEIKRFTLDKTWPSTMVFKENVSVYSNEGIILPVGDKHYTVAPFINPANGQAYLPVKHFAAYCQGIDWQEQTLTITIDGKIHVINDDKTGELLLYRDTLFISSEAAERIFPIAISQEHEYIMVSLRI